MEATYPNIIDLDIATDSRKVHNTDIEKIVDTNSKS